MRLTVLSGASGSGKSTLANQMRGERDCLLASYDSLRHEGETPAHVMAQLIHQVGQYLRFGRRDVIVDACNLHAHDRIRWESVAWAFGAELEWIVMDTPVEECIARDAMRADPVGRDAADGGARRGQHSSH